MLFAKDTKARFRNDGSVMVKIGGVFIAPSEEGDVVIHNISSMSVSNAYKTGTRLIGLVCDGELYPLCDKSCSKCEKPCCNVLDVVAEPQDKVDDVKDEIPDDKESVEAEPEAEKEDVVVEAQPVVAPQKRGRKPTKA